MSTTNNQQQISQNNSQKSFNPLELSAKNKYSIVKFWLFKNSKTGYITTDDGKDYWINKTCYEILEDYFKMQNGKLTCIYNSKLVYPKLTLITEDEVNFEIKSKISSSSVGTNNKKIIQKLKLEIDEKSFTFYLNYSDKIDFTKEGLYKFSSILVLYNKIILGYEYSEDKYYNLSQFNDYILKNIDKDTSALIKKELKSSQRQASPSEKSKKSMKLNYTYLYKNNLPLGLGIKIDNDHNFQIINGKLDKTFERILDITKLSKNNKIIVNDDIIIDFD
ncbi:MAG: hypothetical protein SPI36_02280 [Candidatus Onthovivens sp.]|nr:hypothetical protein [Candidatus Onthovivens sp.]